jgi:hypothetical protein
MMKPVPELPLTDKRMSTTASLIHPEPSIIGHTPAPKEKRPRVSKKKSARARSLQQALLLLLDKHMNEPDLAQILQTAINAARSIAESTRQRDRDAVLLTLEKWEALTNEELCDDTGLSRWVVDTILNELIEQKLVEKRPQHNPAFSQGASLILIYSLTHTPPFK